MTAVAMLIFGIVLVYMATTGRWSAMLAAIKNNQPASQ